MVISKCSTLTASRFFLMSLRRDAAVLVRRLSLPHPSCALKVPSFRTLAVRGSSPLPVASEACAKVIDGKYVSKLIRDEMSAEVSRMKEAIGVGPALAVILVGDRKDSATYERNKKKACESVGINSFEVHLPADSTEEQVLKFITGFNDDPSVHGIHVQLQLPSHMNEQSILDAVSIEKDVDGFRQLDIGRLARRGREPLFVPCTPKGCIEPLNRYGIGIKGKRAVVIGRSKLL